MALKGINRELMDLGRDSVLAWYGDPLPVELPFESPSCFEESTKDTYNLSPIYGPSQSLESLGRPDFSYNNAATSPGTRSEAFQMAQTPCDHCRAIKTKCEEDGELPCKSCKADSLECSITKENFSPVLAPSSLATGEKVTFAWPTGEYMFDKQVYVPRVKTFLIYGSEDVRISGEKPQVSEGQAVAAASAIEKLVNKLVPTIREADEVGVFDVIFASLILDWNVKDVWKKFDKLSFEKESRNLDKLRFPLGRHEDLMFHLEGFERKRNLRLGAGGVGKFFKAGRMKYSKIKRGLSGFINETRVSAIADTGSAQNIISAAYASDMKLPIEYISSPFQLGNSKTIQSIEDPTKSYDLLFHVLPTCIYDVILGGAFLTATETLSKYGRRLTECVFSMAKVFKFGFLGNTCHRLGGILDDKHPVLAVPDTGAERNVMDAWYAKIVGFHINTGLGTQNVLQFADGSYQETIGQTTTTWTFPSGEKALITFEVLEDCASDVVVGEDFIFEHKIFQEHRLSLVTLPSENESYELAPFDFISSWQQKYLNVKSKLQNHTTADTASPRNSTVSTDSHNERLRRDIWNHKYEFGSKATPEEVQAETKKRDDYKRGRNQHASVEPGAHIPRIPSIPTSSARALRSNRVVTANNLDPSHSQSP